MEFFSRSLYIRLVREFVKKFPFEKVERIDRNNFFWIKVYVSRLFGLRLLKLLKDRLPNLDFSYNDVNWQSRE